MRIIKVERCWNCPYLKPFGPYTWQCELLGESVCEASDPRDKVPITLQDKGEIPNWCPLEEAK